MSRRGRIMLWCSLSTVSVLAYSHVPRLLQFERVEATLTRGHSYEAFAWGESIDFCYEVGPRKYEVKGVKVTGSDAMSWGGDGGAGSAFPIYCNRWLHWWWRWDDMSSGVRQMCDAFLGLSLMFVLLIARDSKKLESEEKKMGPTYCEVSGNA